MFVKETEKVLSSKDVGNDLISLTRLQQKHKVRYIAHVRDQGKNVFVLGQLGWAWLE